jgi:hypothetical protein
MKWARNLPIWVQNALFALMALVVVTVLAGLPIWAGIDSHNRKMHRNARMHEQFEQVCDHLHSHPLFNDDRWLCVSDNNTVTYDQQNPSWR